MTSTNIRVAIADDHEVTRTGIKTTLQTACDIELVGEAKDGDGAKNLIARLKPHVFILDLIMPGASPSEIVLWAARHHPETAVLILTAHEREHYLAQMLQVGAVGFLDKNEGTEELLSAIRRAAEGQLVYTQEQQHRVQQWYRAVQQPWQSLSDREQGVLRLLGQGLSNKAIAQQSGISEKTVSKHVSAVFAAIGVTSRTAAALWWIQSGLADE
jgi:DNA-binding NarL/FixJ family response regulator